MHTSYDDIIDKLGEPLWWYRSDAAVPRYAPFHPELCGVYDKCVALTEIVCQTCNKHFMVSVALRTHDSSFRKVKEIMPTTFYGGSFDTWGDPPIHGCSGDTMWSGLNGIVEFWIKETSQYPYIQEWIRHPEYEFDYSTRD
jgi:hypothetical protein